MDMWKVVAAAGAGYVAQHWKKVKDDKQDVVNSRSENDVLTLAESSSVRQQVPEKSLPFPRVSSRKKKEKDVCPGIDVSFQDIPVEDSFNDTFGRETLTLGNLAYSIQHEGEGCSDDIPRTNGDNGFQQSREVCFCCNPTTSTTTLRTRRLRGKVLKPLTSLESCLMAQLYTEHAHFEDYVLDSIHSPRTPTNSPFTARGRSTRNSRIDGDFLNKQPAKNFSCLKEKPICGIPHLPRIGDSSLRKKSPCPTGPPHGVLLFCLGISAGILSSFLANQQEVDKLNQMLRQTKNLVEDLQDELEMKDSVTVKEIAVEDDESQDTHHDSLDYGHSLEPNGDDSMEAKVKSLSIIEAELEAELERLELNMNGSTLQVESDSPPDVAVGELKADLFSRETGGPVNAGQPANYAVSPRELSLRLHEVIESRLEARVKELESALQNTQRKFQFAEYDHIESWKKSSSDPAIPVHDTVVINLPDEAQETNEVNDLFSEDDRPHEIINNSRATSSRPCEESPCLVPKGWMENDVDLCADEEAYNTMSYDLSSSRESDGSSEDEIEKLLIQHIVERARKQGSSVILNAQKVLFSGNENGQ